MSGPGTMTVTLFDGADLLGKRITLTGRLEFYARKLIDCGARGFSTVELQAGLRVSDGIFKLRKLGFDIQSVREDHGGEYSGQHCRYILRSRVEIEPTSAEVSAIGRAA